MEEQRKASALQSLSEARRAILISSTSDHM